MVRRVDRLGQFGEAARLPDADCDDGALLARSKRRRRLVGPGGLRRRTTGSSVGRAIVEDPDLEAIDLCIGRSLPQPDFQLVEPRSRTGGLYSHSTVRQVRRFALYSDHARPVARNSGSRHLPRARSRGIDGLDAVHVAGGRLELPNQLDRFGDSLGIVDRSERFCRRMRGFERSHSVVHLREQLRRLKMRGP